MILCRDQLFLWLFFRRNTPIPRPVIEPDQAILIINSNFWGSFLSFGSPKNWVEVKLA